MRHKGSVSQVNITRDKIAVALYRKAKHIAAWPTNTMRLCEIAASLPAPEFFISDERAVRYIRRRLYYGHATTFTNKYKQMLYEALYDKVVSMRKTKRYTDASLSTCVIAALATEAPCIGLTPRNIYMLLPQKKPYNITKKK